jgi:hypothetical protein
MSVPLLVAPSSVHVDDCSQYRVGFPRLRALSLSTLLVAWEELKHHYEALKKIFEDNNVSIYELLRTKRLRPDEVAAQVQAMLLVTADATRDNPTRTGKRRQQPSTAT